MARQFDTNLDLMNAGKITNVVDPTSAQDAATKNYIDTIGSLTQTPATGVRANKTTDQVIANGIITWDTEDFDTDGFHSNVTLPSRFTVPIGKAGKYAIHASISLATGAPAGTRNFSILKNGSGTHIEAAVGFNAYDSTRQVLSGILDLADGDYIEVNLYTASVSVTVESVYSSFSMVRVPGNNAVIVGPQAPAIGARAYVTGGTQSIAAGATNVVNLPSEDYDTENIHSTTTNTSRLTIQTAGKYTIAADWRWTVGTGGYTYGYISKNGVAVPGVWTSDGHSGEGGAISTTLDLVPGDYIELLLNNTTATALTVGTASLSAVRVPGSQGSALAVTSTLPPTPVDGQECYYLADATNGIVWNLKYRAGSSSSYKWEWIGGTELFSKQTTNASTGATSASIYTNRPTDITLPLAGDYLVEFGSRLYVQNPAGGDIVLQIYAGATFLEQIDHWQGSAGGTTTLWAGHEINAIRANALTAGTLLQLRAFVGTAGNTGNLERGFVRARPVRVG